MKPKTLTTSYMAITQLIQINVSPAIKQRLIKQFENRLQKKFQTPISPQPADY